MHGGSPLTTLADLDRADPAAFATALDGVFEHAPWVAARTAAHRPFPTVAALHDALLATVAAADEAEQMAFLRSHPELAARHLPPGLTAESLAEQAGLSMASAPGGDGLPALNEAYRARFGFPFIVCVARHTPEDVLRVLRRRLAGDPAAERASAFAEIAHITRLRLVARVAGPGLPPTTGHLGTHVLDTAMGRPAAGLAVTLRQEGRPLATVTTDADGRTPPLLPPGPLRQGEHSLIFSAGAYFAERGQRSLYTDIPVSFTVSESEARYHIPLLLSPFGYSTYRGS